MIKTEYTEELRLRDQKQTNRIKNLERIVQELELNYNQLEKCVQANAEIHAEYTVSFKQKFKDRLCCIGEIHKRIDKQREEIKALRAAFVDFTITTMRKLDIISEKLKIRWTE